MNRYKDEGVFLMYEARVKQMTMWQVHLSESPWSKHHCEGPCEPEAWKQWA